MDKGRKKEQDDKDATEKNNRENNEGRAAILWKPSVWWLIWPTQNDAKTLKNDRNPGIWVLIW